MPKVIATSNPRLKIQISSKYSARERMAIAQDVIDYIAERSRRGLGRDAQPWKGAAAKYSEAYANSLDFKIAGKSKNSVDLTLSSEMLESMEASTRPGEITISLEESQRAKAQGNILGTYGQASPIKGKKRNFLDLSRAELSKIVSNYPLRNKAKREETLAEADASAERAEQILEDILMDDSDE
jgi:hypothetical protein